MHSLASAIGWAALHSLWQSALVGTAAWLLIQQADSAAARYRITGTALFTITALAMATAFLYLRPALVQSGVAYALAPEIRPIVQRTLFSMPRALQWTASAWLIGIVVLGVRYLGGWLWAWRTYVLRASRAHAHWRQRVSEVARQHGMAAPPVVQSAGIDSPAVFGIRRPVLVLPIGVMERLDDAQVDGIIAHELMHIERRDGLANGLQCVVDVLLFYNPVVHRLSRYARLEREHICDARAVAACGSARSYVSALLLLEETRGYGAQFVLSAQGGALVERVRNLFRPRAAPRLPVRAVRAGALVVLAATALSTVTVLPAIQTVAQELAAILHYTVTASDPAGDFTLSVERGVAVRATLDGAAVPADHIQQRGDSVFILGQRGTRELALRVRPTGGISWSPRTAVSSL